jgi:serine/tyrosine/threonine adenylyltransferase
MSSRPVSAPEGITPAQDAQRPDLGLHFKNSYLRLPARFYARVNPTPVANPRLIKLNTELARTLGMNTEVLTSETAAQVFSGNLLPRGADPAALAYAGHQFGYFVPQLGDGRAILLGTVPVGTEKFFDIQLKGSGRTPFSRGGDGRAALGPVLREYLLSEAMHALGVPTTRALAAVTTGEQVVRETVLPGAVFTRVAASHMRVGTFQYFAARGDTEALRTLADYAIARHHRQAAHSRQRYEALLEAIVVSQAALVAQWLTLGFIHGVMNTDNTSISGETIDYGPCAFMEAFDPDRVFSSIDRQGRYAYSNQPSAMHWNLARLAEALLPILEQEHGSREAAIAAAHRALDSFASYFEHVRDAGFRRKIGIRCSREGDTALANDLLERMAANEADFTLTFRRLADAALSPDQDQAVAKLFKDPAAFTTWAAIWRQRLAQEAGTPEDQAAAIRATNPLYIPRNHLVEDAIVAATERQDFQPFETLLEAVTNPFQERPGLARYAMPAQPEELVTRTFCGT